MNLYKLKYKLLTIIRILLLPFIYIINFVLKKFNFFILFSRGSGLGDGVIITGLIAQLKKNTNSKIILFTELTEIYDNNPHVYKIFDLSKNFYLYYVLILFNGNKIIELTTKTYPYKDIFELLKATNNKNYNKHLAEVVGGNISQFVDFKNFKNEIYFSDKELDKFQSKFENVIKNKFALIAPFAKETYIPVRNWGHEKFQELVNLLNINWYQADNENNKKLDNVNILQNTTIREFFF